MNGHFSDESLTVYTTLVAERFSSNFSEQEFSYDFTRCVRPDGTAYGTDGKCRKGVESTFEPDGGITTGASGGRIAGRLFGPHPPAKVKLTEKPETEVKSPENLHHLVGQVLRSYKKPGFLKDEKEVDNLIQTTSKLIEREEDNRKWKRSDNAFTGTYPFILDALKRIANEGRYRREEATSLYSQLDRLSTEAESIWGTDFSETLDFVRCQRPNGTFYGTRGQCRKGSQAEPKTKEKLQGQFLGGGLEGKVYDIGRGRVLKVSTSEGQREAQKLAAEAGLAPKVLATGAIKKDPTGRKYQIIERVKSEAIPGIGQPGRASTPLEELSEGDVRKERDAYLAALKLNSLGVAHGDLHGGNLQWDANHNRPIILDSDNAKINKAEARGEAVSLLNNIGIRLEESGLYDEADSVYAVANGSPRNFYSKAASVIEENLT